MNYNNAAFPVRDEIPSNNSIQIEHIPIRNNPNNNKNNNINKNNNNRDYSYNERYHSEEIYNREFLLYNNPNFLRYYIPRKLDSLEYSSFHTLIVISLGISWVLDGYEVSLLSVLSGVLKTTLDFSDQEIGLTGSLYLLGCVSGSLIFGFLAGKYGRKSLFNFTLGVYILSIFSTSLAVNKQMFYLCRFCTGIAVGGEYSSIFAAIDELIPAYVRGRTDLIVDGTWHFGSFIAAVSAHFSLNAFKDKEEMVLRVLFGIGALFALPVMYLRSFVPESPRWLLFRGKFKQALSICDYIESKCNKRKINFGSEDNLNKSWDKELKNECNLKNRKFVKFENEIDYSKNNNKDANEINKEDHINKNFNNDNKNNNYNNFDYISNNNKIFNHNNYNNYSYLEDNLDIKRKIIKTNYTEFSMIEIFLHLLKKHKIKFFYSFILMSSQAFFYNGIFYTYSLILLNFYKIEKESVGLYLIPLSCASFLGPLLLGNFFDSWSRRRMIAFTYISTGLLLILTDLNFLLEIFNFSFQQFFWFLTFLVASPASSSAHLTVSEIFPIEIRSQAMAIFFSLGLGVGGVFAPFLYGSMIEKNNKKSIFYSYLLAAGVMIFAGVFGYFYGVDSENKSLEQISSLDYQNENDMDEKLK